MASALQYSGVLLLVDDQGLVVAVGVAAGVVAVTHRKHVPSAGVFVAEIDRNTITPVEVTRFQPPQGVQLSAVVDTW